MSTIDPSTIDPTKPAEGEALTANVRANEQATQNQLQNAKNDIEALEAHPGRTDNPHSVTAAQTGADPAGTATGEVAAHDASGTAHGGVEAAFGTHTAGQTNTHAQLDSHVASSANPHGVTAAQVGAVPDVVTADGDLIGGAGASTYYKLGVGADGQVLTARPGAGLQAKLAWEDAPSGGVTTFLGLTDTPGSYAGESGKLTAVNSAGDALEFVDPPTGTGDVTSTNNTVDNEIQVGDNPAKGIKGAGFNSDDIARLSQANVFAQAFTIEGAGQVAIDITSADSIAGMVYQSGDSAADRGRWIEFASAGLYYLAPTSDAQVPNLVGAIRIQHTGGAAIGNPTGGVPATIGHLNAEQLFQNNSPVALDSALLSHTGDASIHFTEASIDHTAIQNVGTNTHAQIDTHIGATNNPHGVTAAQVGAITAVIDDTTPQLGGNLETRGNEIIATRNDDSPHGLIGALTTDEGMYLAYTPDGLTYDPQDGAITLEPGVVRAFGTNLVVEPLSHTEAGGRQVYVTTDGVLYGVDPPAPGWSDSATDPAFYARSGVGLNVWQQITGLTTTVAEAVTAGERFDVSSSIWTNNTTTNRTGQVEIGYGVNGAQPTSGAQSYFISESFTGWINLTLAVTTVTLAQNDTIDVWVRVTSESNAQFSAGLQFDGSANNHEAFISVPGDAGGTGEANTSSTPATVGANEADINMTKSGSDLPKRKLSGGASMLLTQDADSITFAVDEASITHNNISGLTTGDPHTQYHTDARGDARYIQPGVSEDITANYPFGTVGVVGGGTITPSFTAQYAQRATTTGALTVDLSAVAASTGHCVISIEGASAVSFSNGTPELGNTADPATGNRQLYITHSGGGGPIYASFIPSG